MALADRGGKRAGAGRPPATPTKVVRLPLPFANLALRLASDSLSGNVSAFYDTEARTKAALPLYGALVPCGFPSPADGYLERVLDLNDLLVTNPPATFLVRVSGESMTGAGIYPGDIAIVDRSVSPTNGCIVLALIGVTSPFALNCTLSGPPEKTYKRQH